VENLTTKEPRHEENFVDARGIRPSVSPGAYSLAGWSEWMPIFIAVMTNSVD
jgi:hypothetical protein